MKGSEFKDEDILKQKSVLMKMVIKNHKNGECDTVKPRNNGC